MPRRASRSLQTLSGPQPSAARQTSIVDRPTPAWGLRVGGIGCLLSSGHLCVHDYLSDLLPVIADSFDNSRDQFIERLDVIFGKGNFLRVLQDAQWIAKIWREPEPL